MKPNELVALAAPGSVDLIAAAQTQTKADMRRVDQRKRVYQRFGLKACVEFLESERPRAYGRDSASFDRPDWSHAELGMAAHAVPEVAFRAACFSFAGHHGHIHYLHDQLFKEALKLRRVMGWALKVTGADGKDRTYLEHLSMYVLLDDMRPSLAQAVPLVFALELGVTRDMWEGRIEERFSQLKQVYALWLSDAYRGMAPLLREDEIE